jgi:hypothetical protein
MCVLTSFGSCHILLAAVFMLRKTQFKGHNVASDVPPVPISLVLVANSRERNSGKKNGIYRLTLTEENFRKNIH